MSVSLSLILHLEYIYYGTSSTLQMSFPSDSRFRKSLNVFLYYSQEAKSLISQRAFNPRDIFKQKEQGIEINNRSSHVTSQHGKKKINQTDTKTALAE